MGGSGPVKRRYAQLVQSYRRQDGVPAQRVIANLGQLSDQEIENLRTALTASRQGQAVLLPGTRDWQLRVLANLDYLPAAVCLELWRGWKLAELFNRLLPQGSKDEPDWKVLAALTIQRCVEPGSKLLAQRWFPRTALPELLDLAPAQFHNTRLHRALEELARVDEELQQALPQRYEQKHGAFRALFIDVTDAWFEGRGCEMAERGRTKAGLSNYYKIGIVLLCNERGYPVRWKVLSGRTRDAQALTLMVEDLESVAWLRDAPVVFDRAMGNAGAVARLVSSDLRFLTAVRRSEIGTYTDALPVAGLDEIRCDEEEDDLEQAFDQARAAVEAAGMHKIHDRLYVLDLGVGDRLLKFPRAAIPPTGSAWDPEDLDGGAAWLAQARIYQQRIDHKEIPSRAALAEHLGMSRVRVTHIMTLLRLDERLQEEVLAGVYGHIPDRTLRGIARLTSPARQRRALEEHVATAREARGASERALRRRRSGRQTVRLRAVAYFNPRMFVDQRALALNHLRLAEDYVAALNRQLASGSGRDPEKVRIEVANKLASLSLLSVYKVRLKTIAKGRAGRARLRVTLVLDKKAWRRRRRYDGFVLLVAHPELRHSAVDLVQLYRDKDTVEKDFRTIKSVLELRPVFHYTDPKVHAHVTLCILALLLERTLEERLRRSSQPLTTAPACFEELAGVHLNLLRSDADEEPAYCLTEPTQAQNALLRSLRLTHLIDDEEIATRIHPRHQK
jgi:transposase